VAALSLPLQDFHLLAFASFAGRTHQYYRLNMDDRLTSMSGLYFSFCSFAGIGQ